MEEKSEIELIALGKRGNHSAIAELFRRHYPSSLGVARRILRSGHDSQDAVQSAYCLAFEHIQAFRGEGGFKTWITRIVINSCLMYLRQNKRWVTYSNIEDPNESGTRVALHSRVNNPEESTLRGEIASAFHAAVARLPVPSQEVLKLSTFSELSMEEIASTLGVSVPAAKSRLFRARAEVRQRLIPIWSEVHHHRRTPDMKSRRKRVDAGVLEASRRAEG